MPTDAELAHNREVLRQADREVAERQDARDHPQHHFRAGNNRLLVGTTVAAALIIGAILSLTLNSWWFLILALGLHAAGTVAVIMLTGSLVAKQDKPSPTEVVRAEEQSDRTDADFEQSESS